MLNVRNQFLFALISFNVTYLTLRVCVILDSILFLFTDKQLWGEKEPGLVLYFSMDTIIIQLLAVTGLLHAACK